MVDGKQDYIDNLLEVMKDPAGRMMLKENCTIPSASGAELLGEELEFFRTEPGKVLLLDRITRRLSLDKLIRSHGVVTNMLLRLAIELKIKLTYTRFYENGSEKEFVKQSLEVDPDGNYTDAELTDIAASAIAEIRKMVSVSESARKQIAYVKDESAQKLNAKEEELNKYKKDIEGFNSYITPSQFFFTALEESGRRLYLKTVEGVFMPTHMFEDAAMFESETLATDALAFALVESRNFKNLPSMGVKVWDFTLSEVKFKPVIPKFGDSSILKMERAKESAQAFELYTESAVKDLANAQKVLEELEDDGLIDSSILADGDLGIEVPDFKPKKAKQEEKPKPVTKAPHGDGAAGKTTVKSKAVMAKRLQQLRSRRS